MNVKSIFLRTATLLFLGCHSVSNLQTEVSTTLQITRTKGVMTLDTIIQESIIEDKNLAKKLKSIKQNYDRINSIKNWTSIKEIELMESNESGDLIYYSSDGVLEKIVTMHYGETFQKLTEYYLLKSQLSFVFERLHKYNRPIYYDSSAMKANKDIEAFDFQKSEIVETKTYLFNHKLIHQVHNQDYGYRFRDDYLLKEEKRLTKAFNKFIRMAK